MRMAAKYFVGFMLIFVMLTTGAFAASSSSAFPHVTNEQQIAQVLLQGMQKQQTKIVMDYSGKKLTAAMLRSAANSIPNMDAYTGMNYTAVTFKYLSATKTPITFDVTYISSAADETAVLEKLKASNKDIIGNSATAVDRILAINAFLTDSLTYDKSFKSHGPYKGLFTGSTVCDGYTMLAHKLFQLNNIESRVISGTFNGTPHGWNQVKIADKWYHIDITNNDASLDKYLLVDDATMVNNKFTWEKKEPAMACYPIQQIAPSTSVVSPDLAHKIDVATRLIDQAVLRGSTYGLASSEFASSETAFYLVLSTMHNSDLQAELTKQFLSKTGAESKS